MRPLLYTAILGFGSWMASEVLEIVQAGYSPAVYYLTTAYHLFAGLGLWGLYLVQAPGRNTFRLVSTAIASVAYLALTLFPIQVMRSGLSMGSFLEAVPLYKAVGLLWFVGMMLFSASIIRTRHFPRWSGLVTLGGTVIFTATPLLGWPMLLVNLTNLIFAATVIYLCVLGLRASPAREVDPRVRNGARARSGARNHP